jgi:hypothetical protein
VGLLHKVQELYLKKEMEGAEKVSYENSNDNANLITA